MDGKEKAYDIDGLMDWTITGQISRSGEALAEWRSSEQVDNGCPSTSPPFWDNDDDSDDEFKPSEMFGKHTWNVEKFSQLSKKELRSETFEVNGYKWCILIYPQGCDVCNHLSLFLCVANHTQLLPGWGHFAQFTLAVINEDSRKTKFSDTLHRFCKKEHDWGWKKFVELSKLPDGFLIDDTLTIKAQVQIIRNKLHRPFRCLDRQYRRELLGVYVSHVEQVCRKFVEDQKSKLRKLLKDKPRWSSFCTFWSAMDPSTKQKMSREKADVLFKVVVKHFFVEKEVTSALVMDSLHSGLKALQMESKSRGGKENMPKGVTKSRPIVYVEGDMFILADDLLSLLEKSPRSSLIPKDGKESSSQTKAQSAGQDFPKDSIEWDEMRLTEFGRRTIEIFVLSHIFSTKIEVAYQEAVAARIQEELIREEEEAREAELVQKAKRQTSDKEKRLKMKMNKQKRSRNGKGQKKAEKDDLSTVDHETCSHISVNAVGPSANSHLAEYEGDPAFRDNEDDDASVWLATEDVVGSPVTEDSAISDTCLSGESSTTEQGFQYFNDGMSSTPIEPNAWGEESASDNGSWNLSVRKKSQRHKAISEHIKRTVDASESAAVSNESGRGNVRSSALHSAQLEHTLDGSSRDIAQKPLYMDKMEHSTSQEAMEGSSRQISVPISHNRVQTSRQTSNMNPNVRRNGIQIQTLVRPEASMNSPFSSGGSSKKQNGDIRRQRSETDISKPLSKLSLRTMSDQVSSEQAGPAPKAEAATVGVFQSGSSEQLPSRVASPSPVPQLNDNVNMSKAESMTSPSLRPASNGSVSDSPVQRSLTPLLVLPLDNSAHELVTGLTFGSLTPEVLLGPSQLLEPSLTGSPTLDQSAELPACTSQSQAPRPPLDDFPHIDLINYLFDEEPEVPSHSYSRVASLRPTSSGGMYELPLYLYNPSLRYQSLSHRPLGNYHANGSLSNVDFDRSGELHVRPNGHIDQTIIDNQRLG